mgnify:FL=1
MNPQNSTLKSSTFQMRINPEVKKEAENVFSTYGLTLSDAVNIFLQQSIHEGGLPFLLSPENQEYQKSKAVRRLLAEVQKGWDSAEKTGWMSLEDVERELGIADE